MRDVLRPWFCGDKINKFSLGWYQTYIVHHVLQDSSSVSCRRVKLFRADSRFQDSNNPLEVSPANPEVSKQRRPTEGGAENSSASSKTASDRERSSGGSNPPKGNKVA